MKCPSCQSPTFIAAHGCPQCGVEVRGRFSLPRLARLSPAMQQLAERFLLCDGNLKTLATELKISYPTLRKRVDELIKTMHDMVKADQKQIKEWLHKVEQKELTAEEAARLIKGLNYES